MAKRMIIMLIIMAILFGGLFGFQVFKGHMIKKYMAGMASPTQTVSATKATTEKWQTQLQAVGSLRAVKGVDISNEVAGIIEEINFDSGGDAREGDLLLSLRAENDIARLHTLQAAGKLAETVYGRDEKQFKAQAVAQATLDSDAATLAGAKAQVAEQQAIVDKKRIRAPFSGHLGIRQVDVGQYLNAGTAIVTLQQLDPIYLDFFLPQQVLSRLKIGQNIAVKNDTYPDRSFLGKVVAFNPKIDPATRNIQVRAQLKNAERALLPGMYATASIETGEPQPSVVLPQTAITYNPYGNTVFLVEEAKGDKNSKEGASKDDKGNPKLVATQTFVTLGETRGDQVAILKGVKEGDMVVTSGQMKLQNGSSIVINNTIAPTNNASPTVQDK